MIEIQRHCSCHLYSGFNIRALNFMGKEYSSPGLHGVLLLPFILPAGVWYLGADEITLLHCKHEAKKEITAKSKTKDLHKMKEMQCNFSEIILWKLSLVLNHSRTIKTQRERRLGALQGCTKPDSAYVVFFQLLLYYGTYSFDYTRLQQ